MYDDRGSTTKTTKTRAAKTTTNLVICKRVKIHMANWRLQLIKNNNNNNEKPAYLSKNNNNTYGDCSLSKTTTTTTRTTRNRRICRRKRRDDAGKSGRNKDFEDPRNQRESRRNLKEKGRQRQSQRMRKRKTETD